MSRAVGKSSAGSPLRPPSWYQTLCEALQVFWIAADPYAKRRLSSALATVATGAALVALSPIALKLAIESLTSATASSMLSPFVLVLVYAVGQFFWRCMSELRVMFHGHAEQRLRRHVSRRLFDHLVRLPLRFHLERKVGAMGETVEQGLRGYDLLLQHLVYTVVPVTIEFAAVALVLIHFGQAKYLLILGVAAVAYGFAFHRWAKRIYVPSEHVSKAHIESHGLLTDSLANQEAIKYFDAESQMCERYDDALGRTEAAWRKFFTEYAINGLIVAAIFGLSLAVSLTLGARDVIRGAMTVGDFVLINAYVVRLVQPLEMLGFAVRDIAQGLAFLGSMLGLLREKTEGSDAATSTEGMATTRGELTFERVSFSYREERAVLDDVSFTVPAGKTVAIVGVSGSGKSTLMRLLFRLYEPISGRILLDGVPIAQMPLATVRRSIAIVPQDTFLLHTSIRANIALARENCTFAEIEEAARLAHLHEFIMSLPEGYETTVGERGLKLSGGERQRIAIARAALKRPRICVFDEATSSLDTKSERAILRNLAELARHCTTLVIAHRLSTVIHADQILVLNRGMLVERGTHAELRSMNGYYAGLWDAQQATSVAREDGRTPRPA